MCHFKSFNRRDFLRLAGFGALTALSGGAAAWLSACVPATAPSIALAASTPTPGSGSFSPDVELALRAVQSEVKILPGQPTQVWTYQGEVLKGDPAVLQFLPGSYLGPIIRARQGQKFRIHFTNNLPAESIIHWHGLRLPDTADGHPRDAIKPDQTYVYEFEVRNRAGTYWFHPHPHGQTGFQVNQGLAGLFLVTDEEEAAAGLPADAYDLPLVLQDRVFDMDNQFVYLANGMMDQMMGFLGQDILVNGQPNFSLPVATRAYRLRLLNGSNSRIYKLAWQDGAPLTVIASDGGLLAEPIQREYVTLGPGERVELWADFRDYQVGTELQMRSLAFSGVEAGMMGGMEHNMDGMGHGMMGGMMTSALPNGESFPVFTVRVERQEAETLRLPERLTIMEPPVVEQAVNSDTPRLFRLFMSNMAWTLNGRTFEMEGVTSAETVQLNSSEVWELVNEPGQGGMMADFMAHPMHIHGVQFRVLERQIDPPQAAGWQSVSAGYVDEGWKDTVLVMPGERVKLLIKFEDYPGLFLYHCHNLEHEDMGMMRNYRVQA
ncbi:MAG: multicopper oxidase family protein [Anaerolineae bacterium]|nr:multicopper oxidase family protein [Anaerolineae bacterium]